MYGVQDGDILSDFEFTLYEREAVGNIIERKYMGCWFIVDNGYIPWTTSVPPLNNGLTYKEYCWSEWLEYMRKYVEFTFGILKGIWLFIQYICNLARLEDCDTMWKTCLALHNILLFIDRLLKHELGKWSIILLGVGLNMR